MPIRRDEVEKTKRRFDNIVESIAQKIMTVFREDPEQLYNIDEIREKIDFPEDIDTINNDRWKAAVIAEALSYLRVTGKVERVEVALVGCYGIKK